MQLTHDHKNMVFKYLYKKLCKLKSTSMNDNILILVPLSTFKLQHLNHCKNQRIIDPTETETRQYFFAYVYNYQRKKELFTPT